MNYKQKTLCAAITALLTQMAHGAVTAVDDSATLTTDDTSVTIDVTANDISSLVEVSIMVDQFDQFSSAYGSVVLNENGTLTYTPSSEFTGEDTFTYHATDQPGYGSSLDPNGRATVTILVQDSGTDIINEPGPTQTSLEASFSEAVKGLNFKAIAPFMDDVCSSDADIATGCDILAAALESEAGDIQNLAEQLTPDEYLMQRRLLSEISRGRISRIYQGLNHLENTSNTAIVSRTSGGIQVGGSAGDSLNSRTSVFGTLFSDSSEYSQTNLEPGYDTNGSGFLLGINYRLSNAMGIGAAFDYNNYDVDFAKDNNTTATEGQSVTGFINWQGAHLNMEAQIGFSNTSLKSERFISLPSATQLTSDYDASQRDVSIQLDWQTQKSAWSLTPFLRLDYQHIDIDGFDEEGNSIWAMSASEQVIEQLNTSIGLDTSYAYNASWGVFLPSFKLSLVNKNQLNDEPITFELAKLQSSAISLNADEDNGVFFQADLVSVFVLPKGLSFYGAASLIEAYDNLNGYQLNIGLNMEL